MFTQLNQAVSDTAVHPCWGAELGGVPDGTHPPITLIQNAEGMKAMSARELHRSLSLNERFSKWTARMFEYGFVEGIDYVSHRTEHPQNGQLYLDYVLTLACGKEIAMLQRTDAGKRIRLYLLECERQIERAATRQQPEPQTSISPYLIEAMTRQLLKLEKEVNAMRKERSKALTLIRQSRVNRQVKADEQKRADQRAQQRASLFDLYEQYIKIHTFESPYKIMERIKSAVVDYYRFDLASKCQSGEHLFDAAIRLGRGNYIEEIIRGHLHCSRDLK